VVSSYRIICPHRTLAGIVWTGRRLVRRRAVPPPPAVCHGLLAGTLFVDVQMTSNVFVAAAAAAAM